MLSHLRELAPLCLCRDFHAYQERAVVRRWVEVLGEIGGIGRFEGSGSSSWVQGDGREEREKEELERVVQGLKEEVVREKEEKGKWVERCNEAESAKERLLILVTKTGKEVARNGKEVERLESLLRETEIQSEVEKRGKKEEEERQMRVVEESREKLEEQCRVSRQLMESLEEVRGAKARLVEEMEALRGNLATAQPASKQRREALDEAKPRTAELDARIEGLNAQLSTTTREREELVNTAREADGTRAVLVEELDTTKTALLEEQETTEQLRTELNNTQTELANLKATLTQTQQELQSSQQSNAAQVTAHNLEITQLHERVRELESQISLPFSKKLKMRAKKLVKRFGNSIGVPGRMKFVIPVVERMEEPR